MKLKEASRKVEDGVKETLTYCDFPPEHWTRIRTNNVIERLNREIRRRTRVVSVFLDGNSALMLVSARPRHVVGTQWGNKKYMNMKHLETVFEDLSIAGSLHLARDCKPIRITIDSAWMSSMLLILLACSNSRIFARRPALLGFDSFYS